jgi:hypothetical protein
MIHPLFDILPQRCVVLLEDIDTARLGRKAEEDERPSSEEKRRVTLLKVRETSLPITAREQEKMPTGK